MSFKKIMRFIYNNGSSVKVVARNIDHLKILIDKEIKSHGNYCDLNHIDVSRVTNIRSLFHN